MMQKELGQRGYPPWNKSHTDGVVKVKTMDGKSEKDWKEEENRFWGEGGKSSVLSRFWNSDICVNWWAIPYFKFHMEQDAIHMLEASVRKKGTVSTDTRRSHVNVSALENDSGSWPGAFRPECTMLQVNQVY